MRFKIFGGKGNSDKHSSIIKAWLVCLFSKLISYLKFQQRPSFSTWAYCQIL